MPDDQAPALVGRGTRFADPQLNDQMAADGFARLPGRLPAGTVEALRALYEGVADIVGRDASGRFMPSMMIASSPLRAQLWDGVASLLAPTLDPLFVPDAVEVVGGSFVSKPAAENSARDPHQDPTAVDETKHVGLSVWIPLSDSTVANGALRLLRGSHGMGNHFRPPDADSLDASVRAVAEESSTTIEMQAGEMLAIDAAVIHHSPPNRSGVERIAAICALRPRGASFIWVQSDQGAVRGEAKVYEISAELFRCGDLTDPHLAPESLVATTPYQPVTVEDLRRSMARERGGDAGDGPVSAG